VEACKGIPRFLLKLGARERFRRPYPAVAGKG